MTQTTVQKHIGLYLDKKPNYNNHIKEKVSKVYKGIDLDYGDIVYDKPNNETFINKIEKAQYDAALAITGTIRGKSREKLYAELGLERLRFRRWFRKLTCVYLFPTFWGNLLISHIITAELIHSRIHFFQMS